MAKYKTLLELQQDKKKLFIDYQLGLIRQRPYSRRRKQLDRKIRERLETERAVMV